MIEENEQQLQQLKRKEVNSMSEELRGGDLVAAVAEAADVSKTDAKAVLNAIGDLVKTNLTVRVSGLGTFRWRDRAGRTGRNPKTGDPVEIDPYKSITFKAAASVKAAKDTVGGKKKKATKKTAAKTSTAKKEAPKKKKGKKKGKE